MKRAEDNARKEKKTMSMKEFTRSISRYKTQLVIMFTTVVMLTSLNAADVAYVEAVPASSSSGTECASGSRESARIFFEKATDGDSSNRGLYYLAAISQDPTNADYYWAYIAYLDEMIAPGSDYYTLGSLLETAILNNSYSSVEELFEVYNYIVDEYLTTYVTDNSSDIEEARKTACARLSADIDTLWAASSGLSYDDFVKMTDTIEDEYASVSDYIEESVREKYELISETAEILESLNATGLYIDRLKAMSDSDFLSSYVYVATGLDNTVASVVLIDVSSYDVFGPLVEEACRKIRKGTTSLDSRYDVLLLSDIYSESRAILNSITVNGSKGIADRSRYNAVETEYEKLVSRYSAAQNRLRGTDEAVSITAGISDNLSEISTAIYKYQYQTYQLWAATLLQTIKGKVEKVKNGEKLETLYKEGYYTINASCLIPKLQTLYNSLYEDSYTKNSAKSDAELMKMYGVNVKSIGEV